MAIRDAESIVKTCEACQKFHSKTTRLVQLVQLITPTWPFQRWGIDIVGPLPLAQENHEFTIVAVEYFTKWIEAEPLAQITKSKVRDFL